MNKYDTWSKREQKKKGHPFGAYVPTVYASSLYEVSRLVLLSCPCS